MKKFNVILIILNALALIGAIAWVNYEIDFEPVITAFVLFGTLIGQIINFYKLPRSENGHNEKILYHLDKLSHNFTQDKQMRATRFITQSGLGNEKIQSFLEFAFSDIEKGLIETFKATDFEDLCKNNFIVIEVLTEEEFIRFWKEGEGKRVDKTDLISTGNGIFSHRGEPSLYAYMKDKRIVLTQKALDDFRRIHRLFLAYVNDTIPEAELHNGITPEGMVPPNY